MSEEQEFKLVCNCGYETRGPTTIDSTEQFMTHLLCELNIGKPSEHYLIDSIRIEDETSKRLAYIEKHKDLCNNFGKPRMGCASYCFKMRGESNKEKPSFLIPEEFDKLIEDEAFKDGPWADSFGDGYGQPYYPHRQAFGLLKDGRLVFTETHFSLRKKEGEE